MLCNHCGKEIDDDSKFCTYCGKKLSNTRAKDMVQQRDIIPTHSNRRLFNFFLDTIFYYAFIFGFAFIIGGLFGANSINDDNSFAISILAILIYFVLLETVFGKTLAKFITKTKVVNKDGTKPSFGKILLRSVCRFIPFDIFSFSGAKPVGWHDSISKTIVIDDK
jgi:uncharacterized RDD family membrane protein YckC